MNNENIRKRKKKAKWCNDAESLLVTLWGDHILEFRGCKRNNHIIQTIKMEMETNEFHFSSDEIKCKIHNFTTKYRDEKKRIGPSGGSPSTWEFYNRVHNILGGFKSNSATMFMEESLADLPSTSSGSSTLASIEIVDEYDLNESTLDSSCNSSKMEDVPTKRKKYNTNQAEILKLIKDSHEIIKAESQRHFETDQKMLKLQEEMIQIEKERNEILKSFLNK